MTKTKHSPDTQSGTNPIQRLENLKTTNPNGIILHDEKCREEKNMLPLEKNLEGLSEKELEDDILRNVYQFIKTKDERFHGSAVRGIKKRYGLSGSSGNKIFWIMKNNLSKKLTEKGLQRLEDEV